MMLDDIAVHPQNLPPIMPLKMIGVSRAEIGPRPEQLWVRPADCRIDISYQRDISGRSRALIRRMVERWDWLLVQAITVCEIKTADGGPSGLWEVIDGQHRVMAALCHGAIPALPATVLPPQNRASAAQAFQRLNTQRIAMTAGQQFRAALVAGNIEASAVARTADAVGVKLIFSNPKIASPKTTQAVGALLTALKVYGERVLAGALQSCADADLTPIKAPQIKAACAAVATLGDDLSHDRLVSSLRDWPAIEDAADLLAIDSGQSQAAARAAELTRRTQK